MGIGLQSHLHLWFAWTRPYGHHFQICRYWLISLRSLTCRLDDTNGGIDCDGAAHTSPAGSWHISSVDSSLEKLGNRDAWLEKQWIIRPRFTAELFSKQFLFTMSDSSCNDDVTISCSCCSHGCLRGIYSTTCAL